MASTGGSKWKWELENNGTRKGESAETGASDRMTESKRAQALRYDQLNIISFFFYFFLRLEFEIDP